MTTVTLVHWTPNEATNLPALAAVRNDILHAKWYAELFKEHYAAGGEKFRLIEPLAIAALTKYFRAFGSGRRESKLRIEDASDLSSKLVAAHHNLRGIRDRHFQHPVNRFEVDYVTIQVAEHGTPKAQATAVSAGSHAIWAISLEAADALIELCGYWLRKTWALEKSECERLMGRAAQLSVTELNALSMAREEPCDDPFQLR